MGWWLGLAPATLEFWVRFPSERNQGKQAHPELKHRVPLRVPSPPWVGSRSPMGWWLGLAPVTLEFWVRFPNERNQGKQAHPELKYRVPHGSHIHTGLGSPSLIAHVPPANSFVIGPAVIKHTHRAIPKVHMRCLNVVIAVAEVACCADAGRQRASGFERIASGDAMLVWFNRHVPKSRLPSLLKVSSLCRPTL